MFGLGLLKAMRMRMFFSIRHTAKIRANHPTAISQCVKPYGRLAILTQTTKK